MKSTIEPYIYREYPKMRYHPDRDPVVVDDYDAEQALGPDWYDSPTAAAAAKEKLRHLVIEGGHPETEGAEVRASLIKEGIVTPRPEGALRDRK